MNRRPNTASKVVAGFGNSRGPIVTPSDIVLGRAARRASEKLARRLHLPDAAPARKKGGAI